VQNKAYLFIAISALIHTSVIGIISQQVSKKAPAEHGRSALNVEITQSTNTITEQAHSSSKKTVNKTTVSSATEQTRQTMAAVIKKNKNDATNNLNLANNVNIDKEKTEKTEKTVPPVADQPVQIPVNNELTTDTAKEINSDLVLATLQQELTKYFYYPKSAQRKNWQGLVILSFTIMPDGIIHKIEINKSSGYDALDHAAISALKEIKIQSELAIALNGNQLHQLLPVNYKLTY